MTLPSDTHVGSVTLRVHDADALTPFYATLLGIDPETEGDTTTFAADGETVLKLVEAPDAPARTPDEAGLYHTAYRFPSRAALGAALERMAAAGIAVEGSADHGVSEAVYLSDPEGNGIELYHDRARDEWPRDADGNIVMVTNPLDVDAVKAAAGEPQPGVVGHVHLEVMELEESVVFYRDVLGLRVAAEVRGAAFLGAGGYHHHVGLNTWQHRAEPRREKSRGLDRFTLVVPSADAVEAVVERAAAHGIPVEEQGAAVMLIDPSGIRVRVTAE